MKSLKACTVTLMSTDLERSIDFYCNVLGLELIQNYGGYYAEVQGPGFKIGLHPAKETISGNGTSIGFGVTELDNEVAYLRSHSIEISVKQDGPIRLASFQDPDGNELFLAELTEDQK